MMSTSSLPFNSEPPQPPDSTALAKREGFRIPALEPWPSVSNSPNNMLDRSLRSMNISTLADIQGLSAIPQIYQMLFYRTRKFAATVRELVDVAPASWAETACLLVDWGVNVLRHEEVGLERFLHSQRESLYWILDDALLSICMDQWDPPQFTTLPSSHSNQSHTSSTPTSRVVSWDIATAPVQLALSRVRVLLPHWAAQDLKDWERWGLTCPDERARYLTAGWFRHSTTFLHESTRIHEIWRTMGKWGGGQLPAELANVIMEDVAKFENLPTVSLRFHYFPKSRGRTC
jgi:hypothetical protein